MTHLEPLVELPGQHQLHDLGSSILKQATLLTLVHPAVTRLQA